MAKASSKKRFREELADRYPKGPRSRKEAMATVTVRMQPDLHERLLDASRREAMSINRICTVAIERALDDIESDPSEYFRAPAATGGKPTDTEDTDADEPE